MSPQHVRWLLAEALVPELPPGAVMDGCTECDPNGGCPCIQECRTEMAERLADVAMRVMGYGV